ncbi:hypothetical protein PVAP13_4NG296332 [Panicum virgatum]|uniref:Uncharacterized protein n=1 Tax=Panicum virgatum TaxID=38727 RepID=A0A8T0TCC6_PANVG|nr:hypothetical protein PVAP13_4NG296332 [Panicum virgatum]KAG2607898.1 hypothetical protein PVAP13_4NG296332 [Panicum virgatum]
MHATQTSRPDPITYSPPKLFSHHPGPGRSVPVEISFRKLPSHLPHALIRCAYGARHIRSRTAGEVFIHGGSETSTKEKKRRVRARIFIQSQSLFPTASSLEGRAAWRWRGEPATTGHGGTVRSGKELGRRRRRLALGRCRGLVEL